MVVAYTLLTTGNSGSFPSIITPGTYSTTTIKAGIHVSTGINSLMNIYY
jgi:hypothetical protein